MLARGVGVVEEEVGAAAAAVSVADADAAVAAKDDDEETIRMRLDSELLRTAWLRDRLEDAFTRLAETLVCAKHADPDSGRLEKDAAAAVGDDITGGGETAAVAIVIASVLLPALDPPERSSSRARRCRSAVVETGGEDAARGAIGGLEVVVKKL